MIPLRQWILPLSARLCQCSGRKDRYCEEDKYCVENGSGLRLRNHRYLALSRFFHRIELGVYRIIFDVRTVNWFKGQVKDSLLANGTARVRNCRVRSRTHRSGDTSPPYGRIAFALTENIRQMRRLPSVSPSGLLRLFAS